jgi:hypothetical protein
MPEISRFFGIIIKMYWEKNMRHHLPHFHAYYQDEVAAFSIDPVEMLAGQLPRRQKRLVEAWAELHQKELMKVWDRMILGEPSQPIEPLK